MDSNMFLVLLGITITVIVGVIGIIYTYRIRNIPKLTFLEQDFFSLFKSIIKNMEGINITFENIQINPSLLMLKASFINNGTIDIDSSMVHEPLKIKLPENCKWKRVKITKTSPNTNINFKMSDVVTEFDWDLLKKNEYFSFDALIEIIDDPKESIDIDNEYIKKISKKMSISHRITNLEKISKNNLHSITKYTNIKNIPFPFILLLIMGFLFMVLILNTNTPDNFLWNTHYIIKDLKNNNIEIELLYLKNDKIQIKSIDNKYKELLTIDEFVKKYNIPLKVVYNSRSKYILLILLLIFLLAGIFSFILWLKIFPNMIRREYYIKILQDIK